MASRRSSSSKKKGKKRAAKRGAKRSAKKSAKKSVTKAPKKPIKRPPEKPSKKPAARAGGTSTKKAASRPAKAPPKKPSTKKPAFNAKTDSANDPNWIAPVWDDEHLLGAHVSTAGGSHLAPARARAIGASAMQIFTKMANRWAERICPDDECVTFRAALGDTRVRATIAHDSYLINLASPDATLRRRSIESFVAELQRCEALGLTYLVSHPGNYIDDRASGIRRNADAIGEALSRVPGKTILCMETTAGSGTAIGSTFEDLAALIESVPSPVRGRVAVCVDTCHMYSAGYDLVNAYEDVWKRFDDMLGRQRLAVMHLNDSKTPFNSKRDRHELIAEGSLGERAFRHIMNDERLLRVPKVLETPKGTDPTATDARMLARLRSYLGTRG
ncbi:MAG TPA: deoxyribonuclease IV [Gemmatimonadaceae bacterium]|nr:deoxyribonuclease IV [Gemmatimonadaceae bacterium]